MLFAIALAILFTIPCLAFPEQLMGLYTRDIRTRSIAARYLRLYALTFFPAVGATLLSTMLRCMEKASLPLYAGIASAVLNTVLNYILIFGKFGFSAMGVTGAAIATVVSQAVNFLVILFLFLNCWRNMEKYKNTDPVRKKFDWKQYAAMLLPVLVCEFMWSLGENVYAGIYGHLGTESCAAMTLINPIQGLMIGALCGLSQAAGVIIGKMLGNGEFEEAYSASKKLIYYGFVGSCFLSFVIILTMNHYVEIYQVEDTVKQLTKQILIAYALIAPFKVQNMIVGGGILRSGGKTDYVMWIDLIGTWIFGVPLGLIAAFVLSLSIPYVYFILSLEECVRFGISLYVFRKKKWMQSLHV